MKIIWFFVKYSGGNMKKNVLKSLIILSLLSTTLGGCTTKTDSNKEKSSATTESTEATSGASQNFQYASIDELKEDYDIVIIGAGGAGMAAAISAKESGANPVIFEKMPIAGGNTMKASAGMNASETKFQEKEGIKDSNDLFYEETLVGGKETNNKELLRYFVDHSASAIDWLDSMGIELNNLTTTGGMSVKRTHRPADGSAVGEYLVDGLLRNISERKIPIFVNADVTEINEKNGKVDGVKVVFNGKEKKEVQANAVVVTTGGFGANMDMVTEQKPELSGYVSTNQEGSTGDGIKMIEKLGGATVDMDQIQIHPTVQQESAYLITEAVRGEGSILVNQKGERFVNELETRDKVSAAINNLDEGYAYLIFDDALRERVTAINFYKEQGFVEEGNTIEELAKKIDIPANNLDETLKKWNDAVKAQKDNEFDRSTGMDEPLEKAPYYAIKVAPGIHHTMGGVVINTRTEVLKKDNQPIPGLYAAGEVTGGLHGQNRIGGNAVADIIIFGRQAGEQSAKFVK